MDTYTEEWLTVEQLLAIPLFSHLKAETLAKWRQLGKGPKFSKIGRKPVYRRSWVNEWLEEQANGIKREMRPMVLPLPHPRQGLRREHRLGRHQTKRERGQTRDQA